MASIWTPITDSPKGRVAVAGSTVSTARMCSRSKSCWLDMMKDTQEGWRHDAAARQIVTGRPIFVTMPVSVQRAASVHCRLTRQAECGNMNGFDSFQLETIKSIQRYETPLGLPFS